MEDYKKFRSAQKEKDLAFIAHLLYEINEYTAQNEYEPKSTIIDIAEFILWLFKTEGENETGSSRDKYQGTDPELDQ